MIFIAMDSCDTGVDTDLLAPEQERISQDNVSEHLTKCKRQVKQKLRGTRAWVWSPNICVIVLLKFACMFLTL